MLGSLPMIRHFVLFNVQPEMPESEFCKMLTLARGLADSIAEIQQCHFGETFDAVMPPTRMYCMSMAFEDIDALNRYLYHPGHIRFKDVFRGSINDRITHTVDDSPSIDDLIDGQPEATPPA